MYTVYIWKEQLYSKQRQDKIYLQVKKIPFF